MESKLRHEEGEARKLVVECTDYKAWGAKLLVLEKRT